MDYVEEYQFDKPVVLLGGGQCAFDLLHTLLQKNYPLIAADGGANHLRGKSVVPELIVGDLDSLVDQDEWEMLTTVVRVAEQDSTDFEKCLYTVKAPLYVALGFTGNRLDHTLAALNVMAKYCGDKTIILVADCDVLLVRRGSFGIELTAGMRLSIFPLQPVRFARSVGLLYPLDGLTLSPTAMIGTSNEVSEDAVQLDVEPASRGVYAVVLPLVALDLILNNRDFVT